MKLLKLITTFIVIAGVGSDKTAGILNLKLYYFFGGPYFSTEVTAQESQLSNQEFLQSYSVISVWISAILSKLKAKTISHSQEENSVDLGIIGYMINRELADLKSLLDLKPLHPKLEYQFKFVSFIFRVFYDSMFVLTALSLNASEQDMIDRICQQSLELLDLHDPFGNPDPLTPCYSVRVFLNKTFFKYWKKVIEANTELPESVRVMLYHQISAANHIINVMETKIQQEFMQESDAFCLDKLRFIS